MRFPLLPSFPEIPEGLDPRLSDYISELHKLLDRQFDYISREFALSVASYPGPTPPTDVVTSSSSSSPTLLGTLRTVNVNRLVVAFLYTLATNKTAGASAGGVNAQILVDGAAPVNSGASGHGPLAAQNQTENGSFIWTGALSPGIHTFQVGAYKDNAADTWNLGTGLVVLSL